jgi:hypothetical protein
MLVAPKHKYGGVPVLFQPAIQSCLVAGVTWGVVGMISVVAHLLLLLLTNLSCPQQRQTKGEGQLKHNDVASSFLHHREVSWMHWLLSLYL